MGYYFRKSVRFGPLRFNFSKSGIGVSAGVKGARISTGPRGTYVHAGSHGFYYQQKIGSTFSPKYNNSANVRPKIEDDTIRSAEVSNLVSTSSAKIIQQINTQAKETRFAPYIAILSAVLSLVTFALLQNFCLFFRCLIQRP